MTDWTLATDATRDEIAVFSSLDATFAVSGKRITRDPLSEVRLVTVADRRYYVKRYSRPAQNPLRYWLWRPRIVAEWENLLAFDAWGIPTARVVAYGMERRAGRFVRGAMITQEIEGTTDLARLVKHADAHLADRQWVDEMMQQVACIVRTLHGHRFTHNDLHWRNLLYCHRDHRIYLIDCPSGAHWFGSVLRYRIYKDLASLDRTAQAVLSRTQRMRFILHYLNRKHLGADGRRLIRNIFKAHARRKLRKRLGF